MIELKTAIALAVLFSILAPGAQRTFSVCETGHVGEQLDGKTVRIRGTWREAFPGAGLFDELVDDKCPGVQIHVVSAAGSLPYAPPTGYKPDLISVRRAQSLAERALTDGRDLSATIVGVLYVQKKEDYVPAQPLNKDVTIPPHHKWYPFILLIEAVPEVKER